MRILILGASYGSLLGTKCLMAGHDVTLVCRAPTAALINEMGTRVEIRLKGHDQHRSFASVDQPGRLNALTPDEVTPEAYDLAVLAMQEPQYAIQSIWKLLTVLAKFEVPCISLMNMPPLPFLKRFATIDTDQTTGAYTNVLVWKHFDPNLVTLCSPDPQAVRPPGCPANVLHVGLATNFKAAAFGCDAANAKLTELSESIDQVRVIGSDVPVKLRLHDSPFVPFAKWSMLLTGNYRCMIDNNTQVSICEAVHADLERSREIYEVVCKIVIGLGAHPDDLVPFDKYAQAALCLSNPSSVARALTNGNGAIERVDKLVQLIGRQLGIAHPEIDATVARVDWAVSNNSLHAA
jgi:hypothetical protein